MPDYRRIRVPGGTAFFTVNLLQRRGNALLVERIDLLRDAIRRVRRQRPFTIDPWVALPDHLHAIWTRPPYSDDTSTRWRLIKNFFARGLPNGEWRSSVRRRAEERGIGNAGSGSTPFSTTPITRRTWTTCISTR